MTTLASSNYWLLADGDGSGFSQFLPVAVLLVCLIYLLRRSFRYFRRGRNDTRPLVKVERPARADSAAPLHDAPRDVLRWEVEMHETARVLSAQLDSKMAALQSLIRQAREEADRLERLQSGSCDQHAKV